MELAPVQPHTVSLESRECSDCHGNSVAMGYGTDYGKYDSDPQKARYADIVSTDAENVSSFTKEQISAIKGLHGDFVQLLNSEGKQLQTLDSHWPTSMPLTKEQRDVLSREGTCLHCHQDIPDGSIPMQMLGKIAKIAKLDFTTEDAHGDLLRQNNVLIAWIKAAGIIALVVMIPVCIFVYIKRKKIIEIIKRLKA